MREGGKKKHLRKKTLNLFLKKSMRRPNKKNIWQISRKVNEGDKIKKKLLKPFLQRVNEGDEKNKQKFFYLLK